MTVGEKIGATDAAWMAAKRSEAAESLASLAMPSEREEIWRYLDLEFDPGLDGAASAAGEAGPIDPIIEGWEGTVVSVVDGFVTTPGVGTVAGSATEVAVLEGADLFSTAFKALSPGAVLIDGGMLSEAVLVDVQVTGSSTTFPGVHVDVPRGSDASVFVRYRSTTQEAATVVPTITSTVGDNARLALTIVQDWNYATRAIGRGVISLGRDAGLVISEIGLGGLIGRLHLDVDFVGDGSHAKVYGAYFGEENQTLDYRYFMNHIGTNTRCDMFLKGAVEDDALSVFTGMIRIEETGQKTESFQTNKNLILSPGASAQSVPNLEILANDVKCGHGSSVGPLDQDQRYYLMSRGLIPERADRLQVHGFFEEVIGELPHDDVAEWVRTRINAKYIKAQEEGRV
ncbi:MAG: SufB/SufD family protein [Acidimicrobiia bacterium]